MLFATKYKNTSRTISGTYSVKDTDVVLLCDTSSGSVTITLDTFTADYWSTQYKLYIKDNSSNASVNNITVNAPTGYTINGASSYVIIANGTSIVIIISGNTEYIANYSVIPGHIIADEGVNLPQQPILDFRGAGVTATDSLGRTIVTIPGAAGFIVANTVYVMKNGNDTTGLVQRFDLPFLTIAAARAAAIANFTPTATNRILIMVYSGNYQEQIVLDNYIDYDLSDAVISQVTASSLITDAGVAVNSIIYGKANFITTVSGAGTSYTVNITGTTSNVFIYCNNITMTGTTGALTGVIADGNMYLYCNDIYCENTGAGTVVGIQATGSVYAQVNNVTSKNVGAVCVGVDSRGATGKMYMKANNIHSEGGDSANGVWSVSIQFAGVMDLLCNNITCAPTSLSATRGWCIGVGAGGGIGSIRCNNIVCSPTINNLATCINFGAAGSTVLSATSALTVDCKEAKMNAVAVTNNVIRQENANAASRFYFKGRAVVVGAFDVPVIKKNTGIMILDDVTIVGTATTTNSITCPSANNIYVYTGRADKAVDGNTTQLVSSLLISTDVI